MQKEIIKSNSSATISISITPENLEDHGIIIRIVKSGWIMPRMYHILEEDGIYGNTEYKGLMTEVEINEKYGISIPKNLELISFIKDNPNDQDLGESIRSLHYKIKQKAKI
jgi:hypothetical protein